MPNESRWCSKRTSATVTSDAASAASPGVDPCCLIPCCVIVSLSPAMITSHTTLDRCQAGASGHRIRINFSYLSHTFLCEHTYRLEIFRVLQKDNNLLCSRLLDFFEPPANRLGRSDKRPFAYALGRDIARIWPRFGHGFLISLRDSTVVEGRALDTIVIASNILTMLLENRKFTCKSLVIKVPDITGICIL